MTLPGSRLLTLCERWLDERLVHSAIEPAVADLQHETLVAGTSHIRRTLALVRGYASVARLVFCHGLHGRSPMRRLITVMVLAAAGSALVVEIWLKTSGPARLSGFLIMAVLAPAALRVVRAGLSYRQMFVNCLGIGLPMAAAIWTCAILEGRMSDEPWTTRLILLAFIAGCVSLGSAVVAAAAAAPAALGTESLLRRRLNVVAAGSGAFAAAYLLLGLALGQTRGTPSVLDRAGWATVMALLFSAIALVAYLPALLAVRRLVSDSAAAVSLPILGALLFPIPLLVFPFLQGRLGSTGAYLLGHPATLLWVSLPYVLAGAVLGGLLARQPSPAGSSVMQ